jgi:ATP-dependent DNA ligase
MLARPVDRLPVAEPGRDAYRYEPKFDGFRCLVTVDDNRGVQLTSRRGSRFNEAFPEIVAAVFDYLPPGTIVDGELVRWADDRLDFVALQRRATAGSRVAGELARSEPSHLVVFDVLETAGRDLRPLPLAERRKILESLFSTIPAACPLTISLHTSDAAEALLWVEALVPAGVEGLVIKATAGRYVGGQRGWWKLKHRDTAEAIIGGIRGSLARPTHLILGRYTASGRLQVVGRTGPLPAAVRAEVGTALTVADEGHPWPDRLSLTWGRDPQLYVKIRPLVVVEVTVDVAVEHGRWRHSARFVRLRGDLRPSDVAPPPR